jgi:protein TonB
VRTGALISAAAHAALLALVVRGLPWLRPHAEDPVPVVEVRLVTAADLAAAEAVAALPRGAPAAGPDPAPEPKPPEPKPEPKPAAPHAEPPPAPEPDADAEFLGDAISLAPAFDPEHPLGRPGQVATLTAPAAAPEPPATLAPATAPRPRPRPAAARAAPDGAGGAADRAAVGGAPGPSAADLRAGLAAGVHAALAAAQAYPPRARDRGIAGAATLNLTITRAGGLVTARLVRSSGSEALDAASLAAARNARYPAAPRELPGARFNFTVRLVFTP